MKSIKRITSPSPFLVKLLLTIGLLICVPMLVIQIAIFYSSYHTLNTQNAQHYNMKTQDLSARFYSQLSTFRTTALKISTASPSDIKKCANLQVPANTFINASEELDSYLVSVPLAQNIGVYYINRQIFLDNAHYYKLNNFCTRFSNDSSETYNRVYNFFTQPFSEKIQILSSIAPGEFTEENFKSNEIIVAIPVALNTYVEYDAIVYFTLSYDSICTFLSPSDPAENYSYAIFDEDFDLLFNSNVSLLKQAPEEEFSDFLSDPLQSIYDFGHNSTAYKWTDTASSKTFAIIVTESILEENSKTFFHVMEAVLLINLIFTAALLFVTAYINYSPLRKLIWKISRGQPAHTSELAQIEQIVQDLDSRAADQGIVIMDYVLDDLLYGATVRQPELERVIPNFHFHYFCAVSVLCRKPTSIQSKQISDQIELCTGYRIYITDIPNQEWCLFICLAQVKIDTEVLTQAIISAVEKILEESCGVFAGSVVERLDDISVSYMLSQQKASQSIGLIQNKDYPSADLRLLEGDIAIGRLDAAQKCLDDIAVYLQRNCHDRQLCRYLCYELLITYISARQKTVCPVPDAEIRKLQQFKNAPELLTGIHHSLEEAASNLTASKHDDGNPLQKEIIQYVDENYNHTDISLVTIADHFHISIYMVSRLFKNQTGTGFKEYITAKRLDLACQLLASTQESIGSIALRAGFENPTYFTTIFRARFGVAPSKFREDRDKK